MRTELAKDFTPPASPTSGLQDYDLEGARRKKKVSKKKPKVPSKKPTSTQTQCEDSNGDTVNCEDENMSDDNDGADDHGANEEAPREAPKGNNPNDTDELSAKRAQKRDAKDPNADDAFDTDPNSAGYGKRKFNQKERDSAADSGAALPDGSFPIKSTQDLKNAVQAYGRAKDKGKAKAHIISRAKALGATSELPDDWQKAEKFLIEMNDEQLAKFFDKHEIIFKSNELVKGCYDVASLGQLITQLKYMADSAAIERQIEGDSSTVPEQLRDEAAKLLSILSDMASEESEEIKNGTTAEDVMRDTQPTMTPGLYRTDVGELAKALRTSLFGVSDEDLAKTGARNSAKDLETLQKCHDSLCELGATCASPKQDGKSVDPNEETSKMSKSVNKGDAVTTEGNKRGAAVTDPSLPKESSNADDAENTADEGQEKPTSSAKKSKKRMDADALKRKQKSQADEDEDEDDDEDEDEDDMDDEEEEEKPKAKKKAKKSFDAEDLAKVVATAVATAMATMQKGGDMTRDPRAIPNLMSVDKNGGAAKFQAVDVEALKKSVAAHPKDSDPEMKKLGDNGTATLIKAIHAAGSKFMISPSDIPS